jgi:predicted phosphodiesterase
VAGMGPWPRECIQLLAALNCPVVMGNSDEDMLTPRPFSGREFSDGQKIYELDEWSRAQLSATELAQIKRYQPTLELPGLLAFHGSPASCRDTLTAATEQERLDSLRAAFGQHPIWIGGHTHRTLLRTMHGWRLLNPGTVGLVSEKRDGRYVNLSRAEYVLLDGENVQFRRVPYDVNMVQTGIRERRMPNADWWAQEWTQA